MNHPCYLINKAGIQIRIRQQMSTLMSTYKDCINTFNPCSTFNNSFFLKR